MDFTATTELATAAAPQPAEAPAEPARWRVPPALLGWPALAAAALVAALAWSYAEPISGLVHRWWNEADYQYCFLVPVFSGYLLWKRKSMIVFEPIQGIGWGLPLLALAAAMRWASAYYYFALLDPLSLIPCLAGLAILLGGWKALAWSWPAIVFLVFMVPLPGFLAGTLSHPLQRVGTLASTYIIQTLGIPAVAQGNIIVLTHGEIGVVEACNGLRMMMLFMTVCTGAAFLMTGSPLLRVLVVLSAAPISVIANIARITITGILHETASQAVADWVFHDLAGFLMMPLAVVLLWLEVAFLSRLILEKPAGPLAFETAGAKPVHGTHARARRKNSSESRPAAPRRHERPGR
jgi:exosortase